MSIQVVLSDLGGVLIDFSFALAIEAWARSAGVGADVIADKVVVDEAWHRFEVGDLTEGEFCGHLRRRCGLQLTDEQLIDGWNSTYLGVNAAVERLLREVAQGIRVVAVTNTNVSHQRVWQERFAANLDLFDMVYSSWEVRTRKPEPAFFEHVLDAEQVSPHEALFIDDLAANVDAARGLGIDAVLFTSAADLGAALADRGLLGTGSSF